MNTEEMYEKMKAKLSRVVPDVELRYKAEIAVEIEELKKQRNAVILGHNYMEPALFHSIPDFTGDSLDLSRKAAQTDKDVIVFCGVKFMAETAKILNPGKTVLLPANAGCSLAASIPRAIGKSKLGPSFFTSAGARFTVMVCHGNSKPQFLIADLMRSLLSRTAASGPILPIWHSNRSLGARTSSRSRGVLTSNRSRGARTRRRALRMRSSWRSASTR